MKKGKNVMKNKKATNKNIQKKAMRDKKKKALARLKKAAVDLKKKAPRRLKDKKNLKKAAAVMTRSTLLDVCCHSDLFLLLMDFLVEADAPGLLLTLDEYYVRLRWFDETSWCCKVWLEAWKQIVGSA